MTRGLFGPNPRGTVFGSKGAIFGTMPESALTVTHGHGATFADAGSATGATFGPGITGALYSVQLSPSQLLDATDGWGLVVEAVPDLGTSRERLLFTPSGSERVADGELISISAVDETLAASSFQATFVAEPRLFRFPFARFALGYNGTRVMSGALEEPDGDTSNQTVTVTGFGPLDRLKSGGVNVSYSGMALHEALSRFYNDEITPRTDGQIRGVVIPPDPILGERVAHIPPDGPLELSGNPLQALAELHGYGRLVWAVEYDDHGFGCVMRSFRPGTQLRPANWEIEQGGASPSLDTGEYHTDVVVHGATKPGIGEQNISDNDRYYGDASVPDREARAITGGRRIVFETIKDGLESDTACDTWAQSKLDELRGSYQLSGDLDVIPGIAGDVTPGHTYRVPEFDDVAPAPLSPAVLPLRSVSYDYGSAKADVSLSFGTMDDGVIGTLLDMEDPPLALRGLARLEQMNNGSTALNHAYAQNYPHAYPSTQPKP